MVIARTLIINVSSTYVRYTNTDIFVTFFKIFCQLGIFCVNLGFLGPKAWEFAKRRVEALLIYSLQNDGDTTVEIRREAEGRHYAAYVFVAGKLLTEIMQTLYR